MKLLLLTAMFGFAACGSENESSMKDSPASTVEELPAEGQFSLAKEPNHSLGSCEVYQTLKIVKDPENPAQLKAIVKNVYHTSPVAFCPMIQILEDKREYSLTVEETGCGTVVLKGQNGSDTITITDHRKLICRIAVPAKIIVDEVRKDEELKLYKMPLDPTSDEQLTLSCVETQTYRDGPGSEYRISISKAGNQSFVLGKSVQMRGSEATEWYVAAPLATVTGDLTKGLSILEHTEPVNWEETDSCFAFTNALSFSIHQANGKITGSATQGGYLSLDPAVEDCSFPHRQPARPKQIDCTLY